MAFSTLRDTESDEKFAIHTTQGQTRTQISIGLCFNFLVSVSVSGGVYQIQFKIELKQNSTTS